MLTTRLAHLLTLLCFVVSRTSAVQKVQLASGFDTPLAILDDPLGGDRKFVVEKGGKVKIIDGTTGAFIATFLDLSTVVNTSGEGGLLGMAFHPNFKDNRYFFINYTANIPGETGVYSTVIRRLRVRKNNPNSVIVGDASKEQVLAFSQPETNHNGGQIVFNPFDKMLYIGTGDGGGSYDPDGNGQNRKVLLGKILRIKVWAADNTAQAGYDIPSDNPYAKDATGLKKEIWHYGLRNPWRFTFNRVNGNMFIGDVGQNLREEVDLAGINEKGLNFGWSLKEGNHCFNSTTCGTIKFKNPILEYPHSGNSKSVTGGYVYHGTEISSLKGKYIYSDYITGDIFAATKGSNSWSSTLLLDTPFNIASFGEANNGELYFVDIGGGAVYKLTK